MSLFPWLSGLQKQTAKVQWQGREITVAEAENLIRSHRSRSAFCAAGSDEYVKRAQRMAEKSRSHEVLADDLEDLVRAIPSDAPRAA
jgi:hypothetical protein